MKEYNVLDLFSGIGGFSLGLERAGMKTIAFCEIEEFPRKVLKKNFPDVPIFKDVRDLHANQIKETIDVICGGYPCQPFSVAGKRKGEKDDRHLWPEMFRIIQEGEIPWVVCENVTGHIILGLDEVLSDLESEGYTCWVFIIPACAINAIHRRDRVWVIAHSSNTKNTRHKQYSRAVLQKSKANERNKIPYRNTCEGNDGIPERMAGYNLKEPAQPPFILKTKIPKNNVEMFRCLGNTVMPQIVELIGRAIIAQDQEENK